MQIFRDYFYSMIDIDSFHNMYYGVSFCDLCVSRNEDFNQTADSLSKMSKFFKYHYNVSSLNYRTTGLLFCFLVLHEIVVTLLTKYHR